MENNNTLTRKVYDRLLWVGWHTAGKQENQFVTRCGMNLLSSQQTFTAPSDPHDRSHPFSPSNAFVVYINTNTTACLCFTVWDVNDRHHHHHHPSPPPLQLSASQFPSRALEKFKNIFLPALLQCSPTTPRFFSRKIHAKPDSVFQPQDFFVLPFACSSPLLRISASHC